MLSLFQALICLSLSVSGYIPTSPAKGPSSTPVPNEIPKGPTDTPHRGPSLVKYVCLEYFITFQHKSSSLKSLLVSCNRHLTGSKR